MLRLGVIALVAINALLLILDATRAPLPEPPVEAPVRAAAPVQAPDPALPILVPDELPENGFGAFERRHCFTVGAFTSRVEAEQWARRLEPLTAEVVIRGVAATAARGFWVFVPPFEEIDGARAASRALREAGVVDVTVILDGEWSNSVSLGFFTREPNALAHRDEIRSLGFTAQIRPQTDIQQEYWLDYAQLTGARFAYRVLAEDIPPGRHRRIPCAGEVLAEESDLPRFRPGR